jgi:putative transposase
MKPFLGYAPKGTRLKTVVHSHRQSKWTLLAAVSNREVVGWDLFKGSCNSCIFQAFVNSLDMKGRRCLMMDNVAFHKTKCVASMLSAKVITPLFLPPYSPQFQPIECVFSMIKSQFRKLPCMKDDSVTKNDNGGLEGDVYLRVACSIETVESRSLQRTFDHCWKA